jgi:hypothetical protein|tara:strand:+ start:154 stop:576 length:423 start_codon:yes stop_codon:yes gene_type:complete
MMLATLPALSADDPNIRELMTTQEFAASGLSRLSNDEMDAINRWLARYTAQDAAEMLNSSPAVSEIESAGIKSKIDGEFSGWNGPTRFPLKNGQIWETRSTRRYNYSAVDPDVEITRNFLGIYRMRLVDTGKAINVRRIR